MGRKTATNESIRLSPSAINTFYSCPRLFYYNYILKRRSPPNIHLYKGSFIHGILENVFSSPRFVDLETHFTNELQKWNPPAAILKHTENIDFHKKETEEILRRFARKFNDKVEMLLLEGKVRDKNHAWNTIKPKLREFKIHDPVLNLVGIIDSVEKDFDELIYVIDYKTSKRYRHVIPEDYIRQTSIYAYLYKKQFGILPHYVCVDYLRYGQDVMVPVFPELVERVPQIVIHVRNNTMSRNKEDYARCTNKWCDCNYFEGNNETV